MAADEAIETGQPDDRCDVSDTLSVQIAQVGRRHRVLAGELLTEVRLYPGQELLPFQIWECDGLTQRDLANRLGIEPPTVTTMLQRMEQTGLIRRGPDTADARVSRVSRLSRVSLTNHSRHQSGEIERIWAALESRTVANLTHLEQETLRTVLNKVRSSLIAEG